VTIDNKFTLVPLFLGLLHSGAVALVPLFLGLLHMAM
jgi:hypothetical protein